MSNKRKYFIVLLIIVLLVQTINAATYEASITTKRPDNINDLTNTTWSVFDTFNLGMGEEKTSLHKIKILDYSLTSNTIYVEVIKNNIRFTNYITVAQEVTIDGDFRIKLNDIHTSSPTDSGVATDNNVVNIWIAPNSLDVLGLMKGGINSFNPVEYGKTNGWSSTGSTKDVTLNIKRIDEKVGVLITIEGGEFEEKSSTSTNTRTFLLKNNAEYIIKVIYIKLDVWGGETKEEEVYNVKIDGLVASTYIPGTSTGSTATNTLLGSFESTIGKYIFIETSVNGTMSESDDYNIKYDAQNANGNYVWKVKFNTIGTKTINFVGSNGMTGYFNFVIDSGETTAVASQTTTKSSKDNNLGYTIMGIAAILVIVGIVMFSKKKGNGKHKGSVPSSGDLEA